MHRHHIALLACPDCSHDLRVRESAATGELLEGLLRCEGCGATFPVRGGVPRFVPAANYAAGFGLQWKAHARTQLDSHNGTRISETRFFAETRWPRSLTGELVLEVGSGSGRFTEQAASTGATVVSLDYSAAVDANFASNGGRPNVLIVQGDVYAMPVRPGTFDRVVCLGVLQHTPDVKRSFLALLPTLKPGGRLAIDVYRRPRGIRRLFNTRYWVRPVTRGIRPDRLYRWVTKYVHTMWPVARLLGRIPRVGRSLNWMLLISSYHGTYDLDDARMREWAVLDTFDMLSPAFDQPQDLDEVAGWFAEAGLEEVEVHYGYNGIEGRGRAPRVHQSGPTA